MSEFLDELYQDLILDHSKSPRNRRELADADRTAEGYNPLCGDQVKIYLSMDGEQIKDVSFTGQACAICTASASMMTDAVRGHTEADAEQQIDSFRTLLTDQDATIDDGDFGVLDALAGVKRFPMRVKCATLPWHTLRAALLDVGEEVSTE